MNGYINVTDYVLCRDSHTCQACKKKTGSMYVHHVIWRESGGSDTPENLVTLCDKCHSKVHKNQHYNKKIVKVFKGVKKRFVHTTILNSVMPKFYEWLTNNFKEVTKVYRYETKEKRRTFDLPKRVIG